MYYLNHWLLWNVTCVVIDFFVALTKESHVQL